MFTDYQIQRSIDGSTSKIVTETGLIKDGQGVLRRITTTATNAGTLVLIDGTEASTAATGTLTSSGALVAASHGQNVLTSTGAMVAGTHAAATLTVSGAVNFKDSIKASAVLTSDQTQPTAGDTVTVGLETYTIRAAGTSGSRFDVPLGATCADTVVNLFKAISGNELVDTVLTSTYVITVTAKDGGTGGNSIAATETSTHLDWDGANTTLTGGLAAETVTINTTVYRFKTQPEQAYDVKIGSTSAISLANLKSAINATSADRGIKWGEGTVAHPTFVAYTSDATTLVIKARLPGNAYDAYATTETCADAAWGGATVVDGTTTGAATVTIGAITYTVVDELSETYGATAVPYQVKKGAAEANMLDNLKLAINAGSGAGTLYGTGTVAHPYFIATTNTDTAQTIVSRTIGDAAFTAVVNALATTETMANTAWADTTYGGGTGDSNPAVTYDNSLIVIGNRTYVVTLELSETSGATAVVDQILWVTSEAVFLDNLKKAINQTGIAGTDYSTGTTQHTQVEATTNSNTEQVVVSRLLGSAQNSIATTETLANYAWGAGTLASGTGAVGKKIMDTYTPAAASNIDLGNLEFEYGLFATVGGTSISAVFTYK